MATREAQPSDATGVSFNPAAWLIVPTLSLLTGQAAAVVPWQFSPFVSAIFLTPLIVLAIPRWRRLAILLLLAGFAFAVGYARHRQLLFPEFPKNHIHFFTTGDARLYLEGRLRHEPEKLNDRTRWHLQSERIWYPTGAEEITGDILINVRVARREWHYGDRVRVSLRPVAPQDSGNPGGFNYATYLARREVYATGYLENDQDVQLIERDVEPIRNFIEDLRREIRRFIERELSQDNSALIKALVVGDMGGITKDMRGAFNAAGVSHVLSISGLHVAMLGLVVFGLVRYLGSLSSY